MAMAVLASAVASCSSPCDTPAEFLCTQGPGPDPCSGLEIGNRPVEPICMESGWACPSGFVSTLECPCDEPPPGTLRCCETNCDSDVLAQRVCIGSAWACPQGSVSFDDCPGPRVCMGALPGPLPDAGP